MLFVWGCDVVVVCDVGVLDVLVYEVVLWLFDYYLDEGDIGVVFWKWLVVVYGMWLMVIFSVDIGSDMCDVVCEVGLLLLNKLFKFLVLCWVINYLLVVFVMVKV